MRSIRHVNAAYVVARIKYGIYAKKNPEKPWITPEANNLLSRLLRKSDVMVEFGSGRSTAWLANHVSKLVSVEHHPEWHATVKLQLEAGGITNIDYRLCPTKNANGPPDSDEKYLSFFDEVGEESVDVVFVDGMFRSYCALLAIASVKRGGLIVIDNCNWFLPSESSSPNSRALSDGPVDEVWLEYFEATRDWRKIWTSCGVSDTAFYFKP